MSSAQIKIAANNSSLFVQNCRLSRPRHHATSFATNINSNRVMMTKMELSSSKEASIVNRLPTFQNDQVKMEQFVSEQNNIFDQSLKTTIRSENQNAKAINKAISSLPRIDRSNSQKFNPLINRFQFIDQFQGIRGQNLINRGINQKPEIGEQNRQKVDFEISGQESQGQIFDNHFDKILNQSKVKSMLGKAIASATLIMAISFGGMTPAYADAITYPVQGSGELMSQKAHGTCAAPVQGSLRFGSDIKTADNISCYNRNWAEFAGYSFQGDKTWPKEVLASDEPITYYDSVSGKPLFRGPVGRDSKTFLQESYVHGWPSFRDQEVVWENVRALKNGEMISVDGTHLGHNLPDGKGNRYCINLVSISGQPQKQAKVETQPVSSVAPETPIQQI